MLKSKNFQRFQFYWILFSVILLFAGLALSATSIFIGFIPLGQILLMLSVLSIVSYLFVSILQWLKFKKGHGFKNLITAYIFLSMLFVLGGLIGAFMTYPDGMTIFIIGLGMLAAFWLIKLVQFIFMKEEDFL